MSERGERTGRSAGAPRHRFIKWSGWDRVPTPGFALVIVGVFVMIVGLVVFHTCSGVAFYWLGAGLLLVGIGIGLQMGMTALAFIGPSAAILVIVGYALSLTGHC
jgi:hypothetical protein